MDTDSGDGLLLITLGVILILGPFIKGACQRLNLPVSVGYILFGVAIGSFWRLWGGSSTPMFNGMFSVLAQLGVVALLFGVGLKSHTQRLLEKLPNASVIWIGNVLGSFAVGYLVARFGLQWSIETSLVIGTALSATSIAVSMSVWDELDMAGSDVGETLLDVAELDDLSAAVFLAVLLGILPALLVGDGEIWLQVGTSTLETLAKLALFIGGCYLFAHFLEADFTKFNRKLSDAPTTLTISIFGAGLTIAVIADYLGFSLAIGALFAGLAFSRDPEAVHKEGRFSYFYDLLTPFFFIHIGMQTDILLMFTSLEVGFVLFMAAFLSKLVFTAGPALLSMSRDDALRLGVSMIPRAEIALVVVYECRAISDQVVPSDVFAGMVLVSIMTCTASPIVLRRMLRSSPPG